jgi:hypothetical protein
MRLPEGFVVVICPNPKCGKEIEEPILLTNLSVTPEEQYDACPHCFTKLEPKAMVSQDEVTEIAEVTEKPVQAPSGNGIVEKAKGSTSQVLKKVEGLILGSNGTREKEREHSGCPEAFGYLANRPKDVPIPQECLLCPKIVDCMLKVEK